MANTGKVLFIGNSGHNRQHIKDQLFRFYEEYMKEKNGWWKNVETICFADPCLYLFCIDNVRPSEIRRFIDLGWLEKGIRTFVVDSVYGDTWEEIYSG